MATKLGRDEEHSPTHVFRRFSQIRSWPDPGQGKNWSPWAPFFKTVLPMDGMKNSLPHKCVKVFWSDHPRRGSKTGQKYVTGVPFFKKIFFRPEGYSNKPNAYQ